MVNSHDQIYSLQIFYSQYLATMYVCVSNIFIQPDLLPSLISFETTQTRAAENLR